MNRLTSAGALALGATALLTLALAAHAADSSKKPTVSKEFGKPLTAAHDAEQKGDYREALAELDKARALPKATPWETHLINELAFYAYYKLRDYPNFARTMELLIADGITAPAEVNRDIGQLANVYYQLKDYERAAQFGERAIRGGFATPETYTLVSQAYYLKGDFRTAYRFTDDLVSDEIKRGETPAEAQLDLILNACLRIDNDVCVSRQLEQLVTYHPKPMYWQNLMISLFDSRQADSDADLLNIYRLAVDVGAMTMSSQYIEMAQLALEQGSPGDAEQVLEQGYEKNVFTDPHEHEHADRLLANAKKQAASDESALPKLAAEAAEEATGDKDVAVGMAYLGYQQFDQAADALAQGLMKGGVHDEAQAQLLLGIAQLKAGRRADALKAFHAVSGEPTLVRLANLWSLRARGPAGTLASG